MESRGALIVLGDRIYATQYQKLNDIAKEKNTPRAEIIRNMLDTYIRVYLNVHAGEFCCQCCGTVTKNRYRHDVVVGDEIFVFGDCCYFNDKYKSIIIRMIQ